MATQYDAIFFNQSRVPGQVRMSSDGLGWKATPKTTGGSASRVSEPFLLPAGELVSAQWSRGAHEYLVRIQTRNGGVVQLDGFKSDDFNSLKNALSNNLDLALEHREHSMRGWNWGKAEFDRNELVFNVAGRPDFEIPYKDIVNSNNVGKSEVAVEFGLQSAAEKMSAGDELVEIRMFIPDTVENGEKVKSEGADDDVEDGDEVADQEEVESAASAFNDQLLEKADIGHVAGSEMATFPEVLFTTPRGRYDIVLFEEAFRLHGKTYDYKVPYASVQRIFVLPRLDDVHNSVVLQLDPPLRQGQTRYPFLVMQFERDEELEVHLNIDDAEYQAKYKDRFEKDYDASAHQVVSQLFKGLCNRRIIFVGSYISSRNQPAVNCTLKAAEGNLYPLDKSFLFVSKTPLYIPYSEVQTLNFERVGGRTFDLTVKVHEGTQFQFSNINRDEQPGLDQFFSTKNMEVNVGGADATKKRGRAEDEDGDVDMGDDGEDEEESEDEDFDADAVSDDLDGDDSGSSEDEDESSGAESDSPPSKRLKQ